MRKPQILLIAIGISLLPFVWLFTQTEMMGSFRNAAANIAGLMGVVLMLWQFLLGNRTIFHRLTPDYVSMIKFHIFLGTYGTFLVLIHPVLVMLAYGESLSFLYGLDFGNEFAKSVSFGRLALVLFLVVWITSAILRDKLKYRPWLYIHYVTYPMLGLVFMHAREIGTFIQSFPLIKLYWNGLSLFFGLLLLLRILRVVNVGKVRYRLSSKKKLKDGVTEYGFAPVSKKLLPEVGQFVYIKPKFLGETHPFTVMKFEETSGEITFGIKAVGKFTNQLEGLEKGATVYLDGPYGVFTREGWNNEPKVVIAGGIGVTPFVELIRRFGGANTIMFYSNKLLEDAVNRDAFKKELGVNYIDVISREKVQEEPVINGRLSEQEFKKYVPNTFLKKAKFFMCGSPGFMAGVEQMLLGLGVAKERIYSEEFSL